MRVAFILFGGNHWTGGINYLVNLLSAIRELPGQPIEAVLFAGFDADPEIIDRLIPYLSASPIQSKLWTRGTIPYCIRLLQSLVLQRDVLAEEAFRQAGVDLVFQHANWYGYRFSLPTLAWIGDFQHRHLPHMFTARSYWKREIGFHALVKCATTIMVMSEDARQDCERFYPRAKSKVAVLPFAVRIPSETWKQSPEAVRKKYNLPEKFFFLPNQFWKHKNHIAVIEALKLLRERGEVIIVAVSGNLQDIRDPAHFKQIISLIRDYDIENEFRVLGLVPFVDIFPLMRASIGVINPSFYEGWSTTVEEAKSIGVPLLLSNLRVHQEQSPMACEFFDPNNPKNIADVLSSFWRERIPGPDLELENNAAKFVPQWRTTFAQSFLNISEKTIKSSHDSLRNKSYLFKT